MKETNRYALFTIGLVSIPMFLLFLGFQKGEIVLIVNQWHQPYLDFFFINFTKLGDGIIFLFAVLLLVNIKFRYAIAAAAIGGVHALLIAIFKRGLFSYLPRPRNFFDAEAGLNFINSVNVHGQMSFPSGHTASAFAMAVLISLITRSKFATIAAFSYAILVGLSRMYLLQHFYMDVFAGMMVGSVSTLSVWWVLENVKLPVWVDYRLRINISLQAKEEAKKVPGPKPSF